MATRRVKYRGVEIIELAMDDRDIEKIVLSYFVDFSNLYRNGKLSDNLYPRLKRAVSKAEKDAGETRRHIKAHQDVWEKHNGPVPKNKVIDHIDDNSANNRLSNLRLISREENAKKIRKRGCGYNFLISKEELINLIRQEN
jgi:hypothetical protein